MVIKGAPFLRRVTVTFSTAVEAQATVTDCPRTRVVAAKGAVMTMAWRLVELLIRAALPERGAAIAPAIESTATKPSILFIIFLLLLNDSILSFKMINVNRKEASLGLCFRDFCGGKM